MHQIPQWEKAHRGELRKLNRDTAMFAVGQSIDEVKAKFPDVPRFIEHLEAVRGDLIDNVAMFVMNREGDERENPDRRIGGSFERYEVNVLVGHAAQDKAAPIVEDCTRPSPISSGVSNTSLNTACSSRTFA